jgi:hypothetical protein
MAEHGGWVPAFEGQRPPFEPGNSGGGRPPTHAAYSEQTLEPLRLAIEASLAESSPAYAAAEDHARRQLANQLARCEQAHRWLHTHGLIDNKGRTWPVVTELVKWENSARTMMRELGMTSLSRAELGLDRLQMMREMVTQQELQDALSGALEVALKFVPRDRRGAYLEEVRSLLAEPSPKEIES